MSQMNDYPELILTKSKQGHDGQKKIDMITNIPINAVDLVMQNANESSINYQKKIIYQMMMIRVFVLSCKC